MVSNWTEPVDLGRFNELAMKTVLARVTLRPLEEARRLENWSNGFMWP